MRILSISAQNYRTLQDIQINFSKSYCTISGMNNAGKSGVIRLLLTLLRKEALAPWRYADYTFDYKEDKTQWQKSDESIEVVYILELNKGDDPALLAFIEKITNNSIEQDPTTLQVEYSVSSSDDVRIKVSVNSQLADEQASKEIVNKLKDANLMFLYNSTTPHEDIYYGRGKRRQLYEMVLSEDDKKQLVEAAKQTERKVKRLAKKNREELNNILGRLSEKYDVELSPLEGFFARHMPLGINLKDKTVEVPLSDWGSGTQNRTHILMAILQANRIKTTELPEDRITPIVIVEEPECFLHPSAQSEFGKVLQTLSEDLGIQIIATTHSPHMLNKEHPESNILLCRQCKGNKSLQTKAVDTSGDNWMAPFSEHLGIDPCEFNNWKPLFSSYKSRVLLVEGKLDKEYFEYLQKHQMGTEWLNTDVEVVPYGGKNVLNNTLLVKFVLSNFDQVFITYDLDAENDVKKSLQGLGLKEKNDFIALGQDSPGRDAFEGLLPERVIETVIAKETNLVIRLGAQDKNDRKKAKDALKKKYLEEFTKHTDYTPDELKHLCKAMKAINKGFGLSK